MPPSKEGHTEEKWPRWVSRSSGKDQASRNRSSDAAGVLEDCSAKRRGRTKTSSQTQTECTLPDPHNVDFFSTRWSSQEVNALVGTPWEMMPKTTMSKQPRSPHRYITRAMVQKHGPYLVCMQVVSRLAWRTLECVQIEVRAHLGGRRVNRGNNRGGEECEASQLERTDDGESVGNPTSEWDIGKFE